MINPETIFAATWWLGEQEGDTSEGNRRRLMHEIVKADDSPSLNGPIKGRVDFGTRGHITMEIYRDLIFGWLPRDERPSFIWPAKAERYYHLKWSLEDATEKPGEGKP